MRTIIKENLAPFLVILGITLAVGAGTHEDTLKIALQGGLGVLLILLGAMEAEG